MNELKSIYSKLFKSAKLKNLSYFLIINFIFMFVEIMYGLISNSLGLVTDGAHMLLDCSAMIIGLLSSYLSDQKEDKTYNFGYYRSEVLGTFINSVFLVFIALYIVLESIDRFLSPKDIKSDHLILVSFLGLIVNLIGVYYLHGSHSHGNNEEEENANHSHSHSHSHEVDLEKGGSHSHSHAHAGSDEYNENMYAIYIHILADALGSVSVLISSFFIRYYDLTITDPICSLLISVMILYSAYPILKNSVCVLLHLLPRKLEKLKSKIEIEVFMILNFRLVKLIKKI